MELSFILSLLRSIPVRLVRVGTSIDKNQKYIDAVEFRKTTKPFPGIAIEHYSWVVDLAKSQLDYERERFKAIDDKAESVIRLLTTGSAFIAAALIAKGTVDTSIMSVPSLLCAIVSLLFAIRCRQPTYVPDMPSVKDMMRYVAAAEERSHVHFLGQYHQIIETFCLVNEAKSRSLRLATGLCWTAFLLLLLPVGAVGFFMVTGRYIFLR